MWKGVVSPVDLTFRQSSPKALLLDKVYCGLSELCTKLDVNFLLQRALHYSLHERRKRVSRKNLLLLSGWSETTERPRIRKPLNRTQPSQFELRHSCFTIKSLTLLFGQLLYTKLQGLYNFLFLNKVFNCR